MSDKSGVDLIEVGRGNQSKVIGQGNSISEYGATVMSLILFVGQGTFYVWLALSALLYFLNFQFLWAVGISLLLSIGITILCICTIVKIIMVLHRMNEPIQPRNDRGQFTEMRPINVRGKTRKTLKSVDKDNYEVIERWGGVGDK